MSDAAASNPKSRNKQKASGKTACQSGSPTSPDVGAALCSLPLLAGAASRPGSGHGPAVLLPAKELRRLGLSAGDVLLLRASSGRQTVAACEAGGREGGVMLTPAALLSLGAE
ncbi:unnamed protein product, partial [Polarella glacialis]